MLYNITLPMVTSSLVQMCHLWQQVLERKYRFLGYKYGIQGLRIEGAW